MSELVSKVTSLFKQRWKTLWSYEAFLKQTMMTEHSGLRRQSTRTKHLNVEEKRRHLNSHPYLVIIHCFYLLQVLRFFSKGWSAESKIWSMQRTIYSCCSADNEAEWKEKKLNAKNKIIDFQSSNFAPGAQCHRWKRAVKTLARSARCRQTFRWKGEALCFWKWCFCLQNLRCLWSRSMQHSFCKHAHHERGRSRRTGRSSSTTYRTREVKCFSDSFKESRCLTLFDGGLTLDAREKLQVEAALAQQETSKVGCLKLSQKRCTGWQCLARTGWPRRLLQLRKVQMRCRIQMSYS